LFVGRLLVVRLTTSAVALRSLKLSATRKLCTPLRVSLNLIRTHSDFPFDHRISNIFCAVLNNLVDIGGISSLKTTCGIQIGQATQTRVTGERVTELARLLDVTRPNRN
jgi:hypothetical protein